MTFYEFKKEFDGFDFDTYINSITDKMIEDSLNKDVLLEMDFLNLLSPKAAGYLELMAQKSREITNKHFGKSISLYAPLYVSNFCINNCVYCGFSTRNNIARRVLTFDEIEDECKVIKDFGIRHILFVSGESRVKTSIDYMVKCVEILKKYFDCIDMEIYPLETQEYLTLKNAGVEGLTIFQETYDEELYKTLHTNGAKADYKYRLATCERAGSVGYRYLNIGALLGLKDFISEVFFVGLHARYLQKTFPSSEIGISFPRLRPATGGYQPKTIITDENLVQAICAIRLYINRLGISISTRESNMLRNNLIPLGVTKMSAGSSTEIGGYSKKDKTPGQFIINDTATVAQVKEMIYAKGYQPVLKDWMI